MFANIRNGNSTSNASLFIFLSSASFTIPVFLTIKPMASSMNIGITASMHILKFSAKMSSLFSAILKSSITTALIYYYMLFCLMFNE